MNGKRYHVLQHGVLAEYPMRPGFVIIEVTKTSGDSHYPCMFKVASSPMTETHAIIQARMWNEKGRE